jgi:hypothetical protein
MSTPRDLADTILKMQGINIVEIIAELAEYKEAVQTIMQAETIGENKKAFTLLRQLYDRQ